MISVDPRSVHIHDHPYPPSLLTLSPSPSLAPPPSAMICPCVKDGRTPLHLAAQTGKDKCVQVLIEAGADLKAKNNVREE